jgi:hypothetical protein
LGSGELLRWHADVCFVAHYGLKADLARGPKSAKKSETGAQCDGGRLHLDSVLQERRENREYSRQFGRNPEESGLKYHDGPDGGT